MHSSLTSFILCLFLLIIGSNQLCMTEILKFEDFNCVQNDPVGMGTSGTVYLVSRGGIQYIMKVMFYSSKTKHEASILETMKGASYVAQLIDKRVAWDKIHLIISYGSQGTLEDFMRTGFFESFYDILSFFRKLLEGIKTIHERGYIHADLKLANIVVDAENNPMIIDFDSSVIKDTMALPRGTFIYMAPEVLRNFQLGIEVKFEEATDMFAFGILFYEIYKDRIPFKLYTYSYLDLMKRTISFLSSDKKEFFDIALGLIRPISSRWSLDKVDSLIMADSFMENFHELGKDFSYRMIDYTNDEEKPIDPNDLLPILYVLLAVVFIIFVAFFIYFFINTKNQKSNRRKAPSYLDTTYESDSVQGIEGYYQQSNTYGYDPNNKK